MPGRTPAKPKTRAATRRKTPAPVPCHQLKVTLLDVKPSVWRRVVLPSDISLGAAATVTLLAMGWHLSHMHEWRKGKTRYGDRSVWEEGPLLPGEEPLVDEEKVGLDEVLSRPRSKALLWYDFGDDWMHQVVFEKSVEGTKVPRIIDGANACPPEDCGGPFGYAELLEALADERHPRHDELREWIPEGFDPKRFEADALNARLAKLKWTRGPGTWMRE